MMRPDHFAYVLITLLAGGGTIIAIQAVKLAYCLWRMSLSDPIAAFVLFPLVMLFLSFCAGCRVIPRL